MSNMKKTYFIVSMAILLFTISCNFSVDEKIQGNGKQSTEQRTISDASKIKCSGNIDVAITPGATSTLKIDADENLIPYIITEEKDGWLSIRTKDNVNISSSHKVVISVTTNQLQNIELAGSGNITGTGNFTGADHLKLDVAGSGNISLEVNTPEIESNIAGSGNISLTGETKNSKIEIAGDGDYKGENLKTETADINIAGSGNAKVFADGTLKINIIGSGDVYYTGNASITQNITGSGTVKHVQ